jgi:4-amino-4-deoxychorismate lyase
MLYCSVNGKKNDQISVTDRAFSYGDGLFTTAKIEHGQVQMLPAHLERLLKGCERLCITPPNIEVLAQQITQVALTFPLAVLKVVITAGQGGRGYSRQDSTNNNVIVCVHEFPKHYSQLNSYGIVLGDSQFKLGLNPMLAGLKHLNRLEQVMIRKELDQRTEDDLLVCDINNHIVETSSANVFWLKGEQVYTPKITSAGVAGLMRDAVIAKVKNVNIVEAKLEQLVNIEGMFIGNSVMGIVPVRRYNGRNLALAPIFDIQKIINASPID